MKMDYEEFARQARLAPAHRVYLYRMSNIPAPPVEATQERYAGRFEKMFTLRQIMDLYGPGRYKAFFTTSDKPQADPAETTFELTTAEEIKENLGVYDQFAALCALDILSDLFTASPRESFTVAEILVVIDNFRSDPDFFERDVVIAQQIATRTPPEPA